jgi:hypothetical protein
MADLVEKDPRLSRIIDPRTSVSLLDDAHPVEAVIEKVASVTMSVRIEAGLEAPIELAVSSDQEWLEPRSRSLTLMGGETADCPFVVHARGVGEFANLCFSWNGVSETYKEYVLVWRKSKSAQSPPPTTVRGVKPKPVWME